MINHRATSAFRVVLVLLAALLIQAWLSGGRSAQADTLVVTATLDGGAGSLRQVIADAGPGDEVRFDATVFSVPVTIGLSSGPITLSRNITLDASGVSMPFISGLNGSRVLAINPAVSARLVGLGIVDGQCAACDGGGIHNRGELQIEDCIFSGNRAVWQNGFASGNGGAIHNTGILTVTNSTFMGNAASGIGEGGAIANAAPGVASVTNSTFASNTSPAYGGALSVRGVSALSIANSTVADNSSATNGAIYGFQGAIRLRNTIVANNQGGNCFSQVGTISDTGGNVRWPMTDTSCPASVPYGDPRLDALRQNGWPVPTRALLPGSAAIDAGDAVTCAATDQRGVSRPQGSRCDIGAYESRGFSLSVVDGASQIASPNKAFAAPLRVRVTSVFSEPVDGGAVRYGAPVTGPSLTLAPSAVVSIQGSMASLVATANNMTGTYQVTASVRGAPETGLFSLRNAWVTSMSLNTSAPVALLGQPVTLTASFGWESPVTPTNVITFQFRNAVVVRPLVGHTATYMTNTLPAGMHGITATYSGTLSIAGCAAVLTQTVGYYSIYTVTNTADNGVGSLREGVRYVQPGGTIVFSLTSPATITVASQLVVSRDMLLMGPGAPMLAVSGNSVTRVFSILSDTQVSVRGLSIVNGRCNGCAGGGINNAGALALADVALSGNRVTGDSSVGNGGAIANSGLMTVTDSLIADNSTDWNGCAYGGGILNTGALWAVNSTFHGNRSSCGGGIANLATVALRNVTLFGNSSGLLGGALYSQGTLDVLNSTVVSNASQFGGGVIATGQALLRNTLLAQNSPGRNCLFSVTDGGHNLEDADDCKFSPAQQSLPNTNPILGSLSAYGSARPTLALLPGSPAIDAAEDASCPPADARGIERVGPCDIGAFESRGFALSIIGGSQQQTRVNSPFAVAPSMIVTSPYTEPVDGGLLSVSAPRTGAGTAFGPATTLQVSAGMATVQAVANHWAGAYGLTVTARGALSPALFALTNTSGVSVAFAVSAAPPAFGEPVTLTAEVTSAHGLPSGRVYFRDGADTIGVLSLDGAGRAALITDSLAVGAHILSMVYEGDGAFDGAASALTAKAVSRARVTIGLSSSANPVLAGQPLVITATVRASAVGGQALTGTVTFYETVGERRAAMSDDAVGLVDGVAVRTMMLSPGEHHIVAAYSGDANYDAGLSIVLTQVVETPTPVLSSMSPVSASQGSPGILLAISGAGFAQGSVVRWNGVDKVTAYAHSGLLFASIPAAALVAPGAIMVTVFNPEPGGGGSNDIAFEVVPLPFRSLLPIVMN